MSQGLLRSSERRLFSCKSVAMQIAAEKRGETREGVAREIWGNTTAKDRQHR